MKLILFILAFTSVLAQAKESTGLISVAVAKSEAKPSKFSFAYSNYQYSLQGESTSNTRIYKFGDSTVNLQLFSSTWTYSPKWTFMLIAPYLKNKVETIYEPVPTGLNLKLTDYTEGFGDVRLMAMSQLWAKDTHVVLYDLGMTLPTGSTDSYFTSAPAQRAAYNMQLGSGTPDFVGGLTYAHNQDKWLSSARGQVTLRGGKNSHGYAMGNELLLKANSGWQFNPYFNLGIQGEYKHRGAIQGRDNKYELFNNYVSTDSSVRGDGHQYYHAAQISWTTSLLAKAQTPNWKTSSASVEAGLPVWQGVRNLDNIRLDTNYWLAANLTTSF